MHCHPALSSSGSNEIKGSHTEKAFPFRLHQESPGSAACSYPAHKIAKPKKANLTCGDFHLRCNGVHHVREATGKVGRKGTDTRHRCPTPTDQVFHRARAPFSLSPSHVTASARQALRRRPLGIHFCNPGWDSRGGGDPWRQARGPGSIPVLAGHTPSVLTQKAHGGRAAKNRAKLTASPWPTRRVHGRRRPGRTPTTRQPREARPGASEAPAATSGPEEDGLRAAEASRPAGAGSGCPEAGAAPRALPAAPGPGRPHLPLQAAAARAPPVA